jgi:RNA polymerase sigma-70 factor (ECF subfamily)
VDALIEGRGSEPTAAERDGTLLSESLFDEYWRRIYSFVFRIVGDRAEAEDLALEVFWRLYQRRPRRLDGPSVRGWLYQVASNLSLNALRARRRRLRYEEEAAKAFLESRDQGDSDPAEALARTEQARLVRTVLARLRPRSARLLMLRYSGFSYVELASALGISASSVGTLLARAEAEFEQQYRAAKGD